jgi:hypothetical protein
MPMQRLKEENVFSADSATGIAVWLKQISPQQMF